MRSFGDKGKLLNERMRRRLKIFTGLRQTAVGEVVAVDGLVIRVAMPTTRLRRISSIVNHRHGKVGLHFSIRATGTKILLLLSVAGLMGRGETSF